MDFMAAVNGTAEEAPGVVQTTPAGIGINDSNHACLVLKKMYLPEIERMKAQAFAHVVENEQTHNEAITMAGQARKLTTAIEKNERKSSRHPVSS
jgi:hypothetical protein